MKLIRMKSSLMAFAGGLAVATTSAAKRLRDYRVNP
jgi:hypothetical protein